MAKNLNVSVDFEGETYTLKLDPSTEVSELLSTLLLSLNLDVVDARGKVFSYSLQLEENTGAKTLSEEQTLELAGVRNHDVLILVREIDSVGEKPEISVQPLFSSELEALTVINHNLILNTRAQDRTTHAIRAFVRFLFIQLSASTVAGFIWGMSQSQIDSYECAQTGNNCSGNTYLNLFAFGFFVGGLIYSSREGWRELKASEIR